MPTVPAPAICAQHGQAVSPLQQVEFIRKLAATMMVGQMNRDMDGEVERVFRALSKMIGDGRHLRISLAMASAIGGNAQPARDLLAEGMDGWPDADAAKVSVAMALKISGDPQWIDVCERTLAASNDNDARLYAHQLLAQSGKS
ncbi:hypothetical protein [Ramlibacter tataouinensis]|nr:hypothetical protein [Ramlibacter tataouinensis]